MNNDDALEVEGRTLPPIVISSIRTITPYLVGYVLAAVLLVLRPLGVEIPAQAEEWLGGVLPLIAKACRMDPAIMASPLITTIVDAVSLVIYFAVAHRLLPL